MLEVLLIRCVWIIRPLVWSIKLLYEPFGQKSLYVTKENYVIFAVEVNPAVVTLLGVVTLCLAGCRAIEDVVERMAMDIAKRDIKILTEWYITVTVDDKTAHDALAAQSQVAITPLVIKGHKVKVLLRVVDAFGNLPHKV